MALHSLKWLQGLKKDKKKKKKKKKKRITYQSGEREGKGGGSGGIRGEGCETRGKNVKKKTSGKICGW